MWLPHPTAQKKFPSPVTMELVFDCTICEEVHQSCAVPFGPCSSFWVLSQVVGCCSLVGCFRWRPPWTFPSSEFDVGASQVKLHFRFDGDAGIVVAEPPFE